MIWLAAIGCAWISDADQAGRLDLDDDGVPRPADCDDDDPQIASPTTWCDDLDGDGEGDPETAVEACAPPGDTWVADCSEAGEDPPTDTGECGAPPVASLAIPSPAGEQGATAILADGSASSGAELTYRFDWGDGSPPATATASATGEHTYADAGWFVVTVEVTDRCDRTDAAEARVAVSPPGGLLRVSTAADEDDPEAVDVGWIGDGLSLREALRLAQALPGSQVVAFEADLGPVLTGIDLPALTDAGGVVIGPGVVVDGSGGATLAVEGAAAVVSGLELVRFTDGGALHLAGAGSVADAVTVRDSALAISVDGVGAVIRGARVLGNGTDGPQIELRAKTSLLDVEVADGGAVGIRIEGGGAGSDLSLCRVHGNGSTGVEIERDVDDVSVLDSSIVANGGDGVRVVDKKVEGLDVRNTILASNGGWGLGGDPDSFAVGSPGFVLWFGNTLGACEPCESLGAGSLEVDPQLADLVNGDLTPLPESPALDAGTAETLVDRNGPSDGSWFGAGPDIGGVERR